MPPTGREALGLLALRIGLAYFLGVWGITKFLVPQQTVAIWGYFYDIDIAKALPYLFGAGEVAVALGILLGLLRPATYLAGFLIHAVTVVVISRNLAMPFVIEDGFPVNRNISVALAALGGFVALYLLRERDHWSVDAWLARRRLDQ